MKSNLGMGSVGTSKKKKWTEKKNITKSTTSVRQYTVLCKWDGIFLIRHLFLNSLMKRDYTDRVALFWNSRGHRFYKSNLLFWHGLGQRVLNTAERPCIEVQLGASSVFPWGALWDAYHPRNELVSSQWFYIFQGNRAGRGTSARTLLPIKGTNSCLIVFETAWGAHSPTFLFLFENFNR